MKFLIDENLPFALAHLLRSGGHTVAHVGEEKTLRGQSDEVVFSYAKKRRLAIITRDLDFSDIRKLRSFSAGIIIVRFPDEITASSLCEAVSRWIMKMKPTDISYSLIIIEPGLVRLRRLR